MYMCVYIWVLLINFMVQFFCAHTSRRQANIFITACTMYTYKIYEIQIAPAKSYDPALGPRTLEAVKGILQVHSAWMS